MNRTKSLFVVFFALCILTVGAGTASAQRWEELGTKDISDQAESDEIRVRSFEGQLRRVRFSAAVTPIRFYLAKITYRSGERHYLPLNGQLVQPGGYTKQFDLKGNDRYILKIEIFAEAAGRRGQAGKATAWGLQ